MLGKATMTTEGPSYRMIPEPIITSYTSLQRASNLNLGREGGKNNGKQAKIQLHVI